MTNWIGLCLECRWYNKPPFCGKFLLNSFLLLSNLSAGYQRQLTYMQGSGCFGIWSRGSCSLWYVNADRVWMYEYLLMFLHRSCYITVLKFVSRLTVAVVNTFTGIVSFYRGNSSLIWASLSKPHTSVTALRTCVCMSVCLFVATYQKV